MPREPQPQPVYIVDAPEEPSLLRRFVWVPLAIAAFAIVAAAINGDPAAAPRPSATAGAGFVTPTPTDGAVVLAAANDVLNALEATITATDERCSSLSGTKYDACTADFDRLSKQWDRLEACFETARSLPDVSACERAAGYKP